MAVRFEKLIDLDRLAIAVEKIKAAISAKADPSDIPTKVSELTNDSKYQTDTQVSAAVAGKANASDLGTAAAADKETSVMNDANLPTGAAVITYVEGKGYQTSTDVNTALQNSGFQTQQQVQALINSAVSGITGISFEIVNELPATGSNGVIYLVSHGGTTPNIYDEYIYVNNAFEKIGTTDVDLSGYVQASEITLATNAQVNGLFS